MIDILHRVEERRLGLGLTQAAVAASCRITQPHYSKVVGGLVGLTSDLEARLETWLAGAPAAKVTLDANSEIIALTREIASNSRRLASLLAQQGRGTPRRRPRASSHKSARSKA